MQDRPAQHSTGVNHHSPVSVSQCVECIVTGGLCRGDGGNHHGVSISREGVSQNVGELALAVWSVTTVLVNAAYTFFKLKGQRKIVLIHIRKTKSISWKCGQDG